MIAPQRPLDELRDQIREESAAARSAKDAETKTDPAAGPSPFQPLLKNLEELTALGSLYVQSRVQSYTVRTRRLVVWAAIGLGAAVAGITLLAGGIIFLLDGLAGGIQDWINVKWWGARLIVGGAVVVILGTAAAIGLWRWKALSRKKTVTEYDRHQAEYYARFGHDPAQSGYK